MEGVSGRADRWFDAGARALRRTLTAHGFTDEVAELDRRFPDGAYACPCCLNAYGRGALADEPRTLTEEHVPPKLAGGRELLLTCAKCNNESGRVWDIHASRHQHLHDAVLGRTGDPVQATLTIGGSPVRGRFDGSGAVPRSSTRRRLTIPPSPRRQARSWSRRSVLLRRSSFRLATPGRSTATPRRGPGSDRHTSPPSRCTATASPSCGSWNRCGSGSQARSPLRRPN